VTNLLTNFARVRAKDPAEVKQCPPEAWQHASAPCRDRSIPPDLARLGRPHQRTPVAHRPRCRIGRHQD